MFYLLFVVWLFVYLFNPIYWFDFYFQYSSELEIIASCSINADPNYVSNMLKLHPSFDFFKSMVFQQLMIGFWGIKQKTNVVFSRFFQPQYPSRLANPWKVLQRSSFFTSNFSNANWNPRCFCRYCLYMCLYRECLYRFFKILFFKLELV